MLSAAEPMQASINQKDRAMMKPTRGLPTAKAKTIGTTPARPNRKNNYSDAEIDR